MHGNFSVKLQQIVISLLSQSFHSQQPANFQWLGLCRNLGGLIKLKGTKVRRIERYMICNIDMVKVWDLQTPLAKHKTKKIRYKLVDLPTWHTLSYKKAWILSFEHTHFLQRKQYFLPSVTGMLWGKNASWVSRLDDTSRLPIILWTTHSKSYMSKKSQLITLQKT